MSNQFEIEAQARTDVGKGASRRLRRLQDRIPGVVYGAGKPAQSISIDHNSILHALDHEAFYSSIIDLKIDGKKQPVLLKDLQRHPYKPKILHADFQRVKAGVEMKVNVPLHFINEDSAPGVKDGGIVSKLVNEAEVVCLPKNLPEYLEVDLAELVMDATLHLSDITLPEGVILTALQGDEPNDLAIVSVHAKKAQAEPEADAAEASDAADNGKSDGDSDSESEDKAAE